MDHFSLFAQRIVVSTFTGFLAINRSSNTSFPLSKLGISTDSVWAGFFSLGRKSLLATIGSYFQHTYIVIVDNHILPFMVNILKYCTIGLESAVSTLLVNLGQRALPLRVS